jgi:sulfur carrier protein ThiS adenylyltransferase
MNEFEKGLLKYFSEDDLRTIQDIRVGIAGAGGLGSNIAVCLVRSGFKNLEILDFDVVEASNLNRQYYFMDDLGKPKVAVLKDRLLTINPSAQIKVFNTKMDRDNCVDFFKEADIVFEAFDRVEAKKMVLETFGGSKRIIICGVGMAGHKNENELKIRKLSGRHFIVGDGETSIKCMPPLAPRVMACASLMASIALECVLENKTGGRK